MPSVFPACRGESGESNFTQLLAHFVPEGISSSMKNLIFHVSILFFYIFTFLRIKVPPKKFRRINVNVAESCLITNIQTWLKLSQ